MSTKQQVTWCVFVSGTQSRPGHHSRIKSTSDTVTDWPLKKKKNKPSKTKKKPQQTQHADLVILKRLSNKKQMQQWQILAVLPN